jgi:hypothetical protein
MSYVSPSLFKGVWCRLFHRRYHYIDKVNNGLKVMHCIRCDLVWVEPR